MGDSASPPSRTSPPPTGHDYLAYAANGLHVLQAATNHQAIYQDAQPQQDLTEGHHDAQHQLKQEHQQQQQQHEQEQQHLQQLQQQHQQHQQHLESQHEDDQNPEAKFEHPEQIEPTPTPIPHNPGTAQHIAIAPSPVESSPARIIADPVALAAVAAAAGAQDALAAQNALTQDSLVHEALAGRPPLQLPPQPQLPARLRQNGAGNQKLTRLSRACDNCSQRKVKCDSVRPCKPCIDLNLECTNNRVVKRRGPPNRAVEAILRKKQRLAAEGGAPADHASASVDHAGASALHSQLAGNAHQFGYGGPTPHSAAQTLVSIAGTEPGAGLTAESIAPMPILEALVDDFFTYIHPLCPFPHQPTFQASFVDREDRTNPEFLALLASMIGALVASFPRTARAHLKNQQSTQLFPRAVVMVEKCRDIALEARGSKWAAKQPKTLNDAATSYFLALASAYMLHWNCFRLHVGEALSLMNELGFNRPKHPNELPTFGNDNCAPDKLPFNHIKDQVGKRIFWCIFLGVRSLFQLGASNAGLVLCPPTPTQPYPAYPANADDKDIQANEVFEQDPSTATLISGFRIAADIYMTMNGIVSVEMSYGLDSLKWNGQRQMMKEGLLAAKSVLDHLPPDLRLVPLDQQGFEDQHLEYVPPGYNGAQLPQDVRQVIKTHPNRRRQLQLEIQKANIYLSQLATRSYFVELYFTRRSIYDPDLQLLANNGNASEEDNQEMRDEEDTRITMTQERDQIVEDLLVMLGSISQRNLEPNGHSLVTKIRQVASTLLQSAPGRDPLSDRHKEALSSLLDVLARLEKMGTSGADSGDNMTDKDEEEELNIWASLRDYQVRFAAHGGYAGNI